MATSNVSRFLRERYIVAIGKYETERHDEALTELLELLMDDALSPLYRLKANAALADGVDDWYLAEDYRKAAELAYSDIIETVSNSGSLEDVRDELAMFREMLDSLADDQVLDDPRRPASPDVAQHSDLASETFTTSEAIQSSMESMDTPSAETRGARLAHTSSAPQTSTEVTSQSQSSSEVLPTYGMFSQIPIRQNTTPTRTNASQQKGASSSRSKPNTPETPNSVPRYFSASKSSRQRSPDKEPFTGSPSKKKRGGAQ